jgi:hypothetical protein
MSLIIPANTLASGGYEVDNSLRFDDGSSDYLDRTPSSAGNRKTFTFATWFKLGSIDTTKYFISSYSASSDSGYTHFSVQNNNKLHFAGNTTDFRTSTQLLRDPSAWYHVVLAVDTTQATASDRIKIYLNGSQITDFTNNNNPNQNDDFAFNQNVIDMVVGSANAGGSKGAYWDGYLAETVWIDGTALDPTSFGEFDEDSGIWKPIDVSGLTFGTNGFYLDFENSGSLGADVSGNGNNFTVNNLTAIDQTTDTPTNNFATLNPLHYNLDNTTENGNLTYKPTTTSNYPYIFSTLGVTKGKWYVEFKKFSGSSVIGILDADKYPLPSFLGHGTDDWGWLPSGDIYNNGGNVIFNNPYSDNDILGLALDLDNNALYFSKNGTWITVDGDAGDPESGSAKTGAIEIASDKTWLIGVGTGGGSPNDLNLNFGSPPYSESGGNSDGNGYGNFNQAVPSGYYALNTKNLSEFG